MHLICLCATYGRPSLVANSLALFLRQDLRDGDTSHLLIFDDSGCLAPQGEQLGDRAWSVLAQDNWRPLCEKYGEMVAVNHCYVGSPDAAFVVWDDDDVYLRWHLAAHAHALERREWSHPSAAYSTYGCSPHDPPNHKLLQGRSYHGALAIRADLMERLGSCWPVTERSEFDRIQLARCAELAGKPGNPLDWYSESYVYRWQDTQHDHYSARIRAGTYRRPRIEEPGRVNQLIPQLDESTRRILAHVERPL